MRPTITIFRYVYYSAVCALAVRPPAPLIRCIGATSSYLSKSLEFLFENSSLFLPNL
ncbi:hypothetical protein HMPREF9134_00026 [Porphyromonas catoniae F0037]|uniref:Uncharacterized protein n=1 Tax=Porphyromonas catoniae F0037 TaxID=1127696 RepID=L1NJC9_9PORP|nr:hypothetical protein HMPREF9134_00026 [Porphyromonas catoniae F0037]